MTQAPINWGPFCLQLRDIAHLAVIQFGGSPARRGAKRQNPG